MKEGSRIALSRCGIQVYSIVKKIEMIRRETAGAVMTNCLELHVSSERGLACNHSHHHSKYKQMINRNNCPALSLVSTSDTIRSPHSLHYVADQPIRTSGCHITAYQPYCQYSDTTSHGECRTSGMSDLNSACVRLLEWTKSVG